MLFRELRPLNQHFVHRVQACTKSAYYNRLMYKPGQHIIAKINGIPQEVLVRAILETPDGIKLIVDFGFAQTATIHERDIVPNE
jgi:hypothetical protein